MSPQKAPKENPVFSIIMPTYKDEKTIGSSINSVVQQTEKNWELIISDDASPDGTEQIVKSYAKKDVRIKYIKSQENEDQLNAVLKATKHIKGKYIFILHSDDIFSNNLVLEKIRDKLARTNAEAIIADLELINEKSEYIGKQKVNIPIENDKSRSLTLLWLGRNPYSDSAFWKKKVFLETVTQNYLEWNTPFWLDFNSKRILKVEKSDFPFIKYRIHKENYQKNKIGKFCVLNGELRTATGLMDDYNIPFYSLQYYIFRILNKFNIKYYPFKFKKPTPLKQQYKIIRFIIKRTYTLDNSLPLFLKQYLTFLKYHSKKHIKKDLNLTRYRFEKNYMGKDVRVFAEDLFGNKLNNGYKTIIYELNKGFDTITCKENDAKKINNFLRCININNNFVTVIVKKGNHK